MEKKTNNMTVPEEMLELLSSGVYSNMTLVAHSSSDFMADFLQQMPGLPRPRVKSRVVFAPEHAKRLVAMLGENIRKYENDYGVIEVNSQEESPMSMFNLPQGEA